MSFPKITPSGQISPWPSSTGFAVGKGGGSSHSWDTCSTDAWKWGLRKDLPLTTTVLLVLLTNNDWETKFQTSWCTC